jgi:hypothetical protein
MVDVDRDEGLRERLIAAGELIPAAGSRDDLPAGLLDSTVDAAAELQRLRDDGELLPGGGGPFPEPLPAVPGRPLSEVLLQMREDERW